MKKERQEEEPILKQTNRKYHYRTEWFDKDLNIDVQGALKKVESQKKNLTFQFFQFMIVLPPQQAMKAMLVIKNVVMPYREKLVQRAFVNTRWILFPTTIIIF